MLHVIPSNRLETLSDCLGLLLGQAADQHPLQADIVMVQHQGMQHWLSMELAKQEDRQISMNLEFPLPVRQLWQLIRDILGDERVPAASGWTREVMTWRLFAIIGSPEILNNPIFEEPNGYWCNQTESKQNLRRYQLAGQIADVFEQYILYRPDWIDKWDSGEDAVEGGKDRWQAELWRKMTEFHVEHPVKLVNVAMQTLPNSHRALPERLFVFGINTLPPQWLDFLTALGQVGNTQIHLMYLNPSDQFWNEIISEKRLERLRVNRLMGDKGDGEQAEEVGERSSWATQVDDLEDGLEEALDYRDIGNPLLASFGQQGQAFVNALTQRAEMESPLFENTSTPTLLGHLQSDILELVDRRDEPLQLPLDETIKVTSCHTALREVQALHDWLLHQFNADPSLRPRDVLVMCPNVEEYAPFIEAVFARAGDELDPDVPPLPCSIADRVMKDSDPTIAAFLELLEIPDSRFQVNQVLGWLTVPAIAYRFKFDENDQDKVRRWLDSAAIHWGLDAEHKSRWNSANTQPQFTWAQGLERLLLGFAWGDKADFVNDQLLLPDVEGSDALLLGRLIELLHTLQDIARELYQTRTAAGWQGFLNRRFREVLFAQDSEWEIAHDEIQSSIDNLAENCALAGYDELLDLSVVRDFLRGQLSSAQRRGNQFLTGQITVCSMVPMRSVPFKSIAILGLNDGEFPRLRQPMGFDLMARDTPRAGDRSRRGDDQYLFLESILSARNSLYLSYQGHDPNKNEPRQPSLLLVELIDYLSKAYGWSADEAVRAMALQPFSPQNYKGSTPSFDVDWLTLRDRQAGKATHKVPMDERTLEINAVELVASFDNPARFFSQQTLGLYLGNETVQQLDDHEPFVSDFLQRYKFQANVLEATAEPHADAVVEALVTQEKYGGKLPENQQQQDLLESWEKQALSFQDVLDEHGWQNCEKQTASITVNVPYGKGDDVIVTLNAELPLIAKKDAQLFARLADAKPKDYLRCWIHHLIANVLAPTETSGIYRKPEEQGKAKLLSWPALDSAIAKEYLAEIIVAYWQCQLEPQLMHVQLGLEVLKKYKPGSIEFMMPATLDAVWGSTTFKRGLDDDPYNRYFWPQQPPVTAVPEGALSLYKKLLDTLQVKKA